MPKAISLVQRVEITSPCPAKWEDMAGDDKSRFCSLCKLNVYNLSAMSEAEAERLIIEKEGKLCARIYRRTDGTILTRDCPIGVAIGIIKANALSTSDDSGAWLGGVVAPLRQQPASSGNAPQPFQSPARE